MIKAQLLSELIQSRISLNKENNGWYKVRGACCNDHSERAGFKFDGSTVGFSCFNCASKFRFEEGTAKLSREARRVLEAFGITRDELNAVLGAGFFNKSHDEQEITIEALKPALQLRTPEVPLPPNSHLLGSEFSLAIQEPLIQYLTNRSIDPMIVHAHFSLDKKFLNRVILPCMRDGKIIYWQARSIKDDMKPRYLSPGTNKDAVLWGYDNLWKTPNRPLFITEGIFDAALIDGVALIGSKLNESKLEILNRCARRKIIVVDRDNNGRDLAQLALEHKWEITFPPDGVPDVNSSVQKFGILGTTWALLKNATIPKGLRAADGLVVQSKLELGMQLALANLTRRK